MNSRGDELASLAHLLDVPDHGTDLRPRVVAEVAASPSPRLRVRRRRIAAAVVAALAAAVAVPVAPAVADWLGVGAVEVRSVPEDPPVTQPSLDGELGRRATRQQAAAALGGRVVESALLGEPAAVWLDTRGSIPIVTLDFGSVLVTQFAAPLDKRDVVASKLAGPDVRVEQVDVNGAPGLWLEGAHGIALLSPEGETAYVNMRLSANALVFERGGVTFRVEIDGPKQEALKLALSLE